MRASPPRLARAAIAALAAGGLLGFAPPASAVDCAGLQAALDAAVAGSTVTLDAGSTCAGPFTLPSRAVVLEGGGAGATIDGGGLSRGLSGVDVDATTIRNLTFRNGYAATSGGAIAISGASTPHLTELEFYGNHSDQDGGAIALSSTVVNGTAQVSFSRFGDGTPSGANSAARGGAVYIAGANSYLSVLRSYFTANQATDGYGGALYVEPGSRTRDVSFNLFRDNTVAADAGGEAHGGGAFVGASGAVTEISNNVFDGNTVQPAATLGMGGGLEVRGTDYTASATQFANIFRANALLDDAPAVVPGSLLGAGEALYSVTLTSTSDRFIGNLAGQQAAAAGGAALALTGCQFVGALTLENAVMIENSAAGSSAGAALATRCETPVTSLTIRSSTISANLPDGASATGGDSNDSLTVVNSILTTGTASGTDVSGFASRSITYSDACSGGAAHSGTGNICTPPALVDLGVGRYHQAANGPTVDSGSNAGVPASLSHDVDVTHPRILDGDGNGSAVTDMGADEYQPLDAPRSQVTPTSAPPLVDVPVIPSVPDAVPGPSPAQLVAGVQQQSPPRARARRCGDRAGPTSRFLNRLQQAARFRGAQLVIRGAARFKKCKGGNRGTIRRVNFTIRLVEGRRCRFLTARRTLGPPGPCRKRARMIRAKGRTRWSIVLRGPLPDGRYRADVQAVDNLGNRERRSAHRNFRHFRIQNGVLRQGWNGAQPDDYTKRR